MTNGPISPNEVAEADWAEQQADVDPQGDALDPLIAGADVAEHEVNEADRLEQLTEVQLDEE